MLGVVLCPHSALSFEGLSFKGQRVKLNIHDTTLADALNQLLQQTDIQLLFKSELVDNLHARTIEGSFTIDEALSLLLKDTDLQSKRINHSMFIIFQKSGAALSSKITHDPTPTTENLTAVKPEYAELAEIVVVGETHHSISIQEPSTATKVFVPTMEVPRSLEGIDANLFRDRGNATLAEAFRDYSSINTTDQSGLLNLRGFRIHDQSILKAGLPSVSRGITPLPLQNIDGIEVAKGANSPLYGYGQPGGVINLLPKKPQPQPFTNLSVSYGNYDNSIAMDANNPLELGNQLQQRFNFLFREEREHNQIDGSVRQLQVTPAFLYLLDDDKTLSFNVEYNHQEVEGLGGKRVFDEALPEWQPALDLLYPNLTEVPYYPYSGPDVDDFQKSDSIDLWTRFKAPINSTWDYTLAAYGGRSDIDMRTNLDYIIWLNPFMDFSDVNTIDLLFNIPYRDAYQSHFEEQKNQFKELFFATYGDLVDESKSVMQSIYGEGTTPAWSDDRFRLYQTRSDNYHNTSQTGIEFNVHGIKDFQSITHDLVAGISFLQRRWDFSSSFFFNGELYDKGTELINAGDLVTGFALRRHAVYGWYYPYGPQINSFDLVLPDQIAAQANLPSDAHYDYDRQAEYYDAIESTRSIGVYFQDHVSIHENWRILVAAGLYRYHRLFYNKEINGYGYLTGDFWLPQELDLSHTDQNFSPQLGVVYLPTDDFSIYASSGKQFDIVDGVQINGEPTQPEKTIAHELGAKWWPTADINLTSSVFQINKENYAIPGNSNTGFSNIQQNGAVRSTGTEFNITGFVTPYVKLSTNYSRCRLSSEEDSGVSDGLLRALSNGVAQQNGSFWVQYHTEPYGKQGWSAGVGLNYVGDRRYELQQIVTTYESYLLIDAAIHYKNDDLRVALNIDNITNENWIIGASSKSSGMPEMSDLTSRITAFHIGFGYGTRVRLTTELFF